MSSKTKVQLVRELLEIVAEHYRNPGTDIPQDKYDYLPALCGEIDRREGIATETNLITTRLWVNAALSLRDAAQNKTRSSRKHEAANRLVWAELLDLSEEVFPDLFEVFKIFEERYPLP